MLARKPVGNGGCRIREATVERTLMMRTKAFLRGIAYKFVSPARRNVPDRLLLVPVPPEHRELVARYVRFAECKAPGCKPTKGQAREHARLRELGFVVEVVDTIARVDEVLEEMA